MEKVRIGTLVLAVALAAGACSGDDDASDVTVAPETSAAESTTTSEEATTTTEDPAAAVEQAFFDQWDAFVEILEDPDPSNPLIDQFFTGAARDNLLDTISADIEAGYITRLPENPEHFKPGIESIEFVDDGAAIVDECTIDGLVVLVAETGEVVNDNVATGRLENRFELIDGQWKLADTDLIDRREGVAPCD